MNQGTRAQDEWLALRCQSDEPGAYEALVSRFESPLLYYATKLTGSRDRALDVVQDAWFRAFRGIRKLKTPGSIRPWLYRIVHGIAVDEIRSRVVRSRSEAPELEWANLADGKDFRHENAQRRVQIQRRFTTAFWIFCAASATAYLWFGSSAGQFPRAPFLACIFFLWGGVELIRHSIAALQVELQKDIRHLQVQVLELRAHLQNANEGLRS